MSIKYGFYNARNHDKAYDAENFAAIFDGIINDGVFMNVGTHFTVTASNGLAVAVGPGRAWFDSTWTWNNANYIVSFDTSDSIDNRIDAVVLDINNLQRVNTIKVVKGTPSSEDTKPTLAHTDKHNQYPLAYVTIRANATSVTTADIQNVVGLEATPYVSGILQTADATSLYSNWEAQFNNWFESVQEEFEDELSGFENMTWPVPNATKNYIGVKPGSNTLRDILKDHKDTLNTQSLSLTNVDAEISALKSKDILLSGNISDLQDEIDQFNDAVTTIQNQATETSNKMDVLESTYEEFEENVTTSVNNLGQSVSALSSDLSTANDRIETLETSDVEQQGEIDDLSDSVQENSESIDQIKNMTATVPQTVQDYVGVQGSTLKDMLKNIQSNATSGADVDLSGYVPASRKINNKPLTADINLVASDVSAVPKTRKVNNKALSSDISLTATDVNAISNENGYGYNGLTIEGPVVLGNDRWSTGRPGSQADKWSIGLSDEYNYGAAVNRLNIYKDGDYGRLCLECSSYTGLDGGTCVTGCQPIYLGSIKNPVGPYDAANKSYVDSAISSKISGFSKIQWVSYTGNGTYGENNPCAIHFTINPYIIFWVGQSSTDASYISKVFGVADYFSSSGYSTFELAYDIVDITKKKGGRGFWTGMNGLGSRSYFYGNGKDFYWYNTYAASGAAGFQLNGNGQKYYFVGIGT